MSPALATAVAGAVRGAVGLTVRWTAGEPDLRPRVYFANHTSHLDALVLWSALPGRVRALARPVAARDYWDRGPWRSLSVGLFDAVLIERDNPDAAARRRQLERLMTAMGEGHSLIVFPEGTRRSGPGVGPFKSGLFHLALMKPGLELWPAYIENAGRILPKGELLPVPMLCSVSFGGPLGLADAEPKEAFLERARAALRRLGPA